MRRAAGGDIDAAPLQRRAVPRLAHRRGAQAVEPCGEAGGEQRGHVLDDDGGRRVGGKPRQHADQRLDAAGGGADGDQADAMAAARGGRWPQGAGPMRRARLPDARAQRRIALARAARLRHQQRQPVLRRRALKRRAALRIGRAGVEQRHVRFQRGDQVRSLDRIGAARQHLDRRIGADGRRSGAARRRAVRHEQDADRALHHAAPLRV